MTFEPMARRFTSQLLLNPWLKFLRLMLASPSSFFLIKPFLKKYNNMFGILSSLVFAGDVVIDVGANNGGLSILFANLVGSKGHVHAFEPVPSTFETLRSNIRRTRLNGRVSLNNCALGAERGYALINVPLSGSQGSALTFHDFGRFWSKEGVRSYECRIETLDNYISKHKISVVKLVKIDVEGAEMLVLRGMKDCLTSLIPPILMLEIFPPFMKDFGFTTEELFQLLHRHGYVVYFVGQYNLIECATHKKALELLSFPDRVDFICVLPRTRSLANRSSD